MNILVTGKNGQLGSELQALSTSSKHRFIFCNSSECDIRDLDSIESQFSKNSVDVVINCAAYTAVDNAEDDEKNAIAVNYIGVQNLITAAEKQNAKLIHISTDYVFAGDKNSPYETNDAVSPIGVYGKSKRKGEEVILNSNADAIAIRTSWLYSSHGNNFVKTMLRLGQIKPELSVVSDQIGSPTYARDLAKACLAILENKKISERQRIYHYSNKGSISWCTFAQEIMLRSNLDCKVIPISTEEYPTKADRPQYSVLNTKDIESHFNVSIPNWETSLQDCIDKLK